MVHGGTSKRDFTFAQGGPSGHNHLKHPIVHNDGDLKYSISASATTRKRQRTNLTQFGAESLPGSLLQIPDQFFDVKLTGAPSDTLTHYTLQMQITNSAPVPSGSAAPTDNDATLLVAPYMFNRIEVQMDGSSVDDIIYNRQLYYDLCYSMTTEQKAVMGYYIGMNSEAPVSNDLTLADKTAYDEDLIPLKPGKTRTFYLPILSMITQAGLFLPDHNQDPRLRYYCTGKPTVLSSKAGADGKVFMSNVQAIIHGLLYDDAIRARMRSHYQEQASISRITTHERQLIDVGTLSAGQEATDQPLSAFNGEYAGFDITLEDTAQAGEQQYGSNTTAGLLGLTWMPISRLTLTNSDGYPIGFNNIYGDLVSSVCASNDYKHNFMAAQKNIYTWNFSEDIEDTRATGADHGGIVLDGDFNTRLIPGALDGKTGHTFRIHWSGLRYGLLTRTAAGNYTVTKL